jgi:hypothetical protein
MESTNNADWKDFTNFTREVNEKAKSIFMEDKYHGPMMAICSSDRTVSFIPLNKMIELSEMNKVSWQDVLSLSLQDMAVHEPTFEAVVIITEAWAYKADGKDDHITKQIMNGEISISQLNPEHRYEILNVVMTSRGGQNLTLMSPIIRDGENVSLGETEEITNCSGRLGSDIWNKPPIHEYAQALIEGFRPVIPPNNSLN